MIKTKKKNTSDNTTTKPKKEKFWTRFRAKRLKEEQCGDDNPANAKGNVESQVKEVDDGSEHETLVKGLIQEADETDNNGNVDLALAQYQAIRDYIAALPCRTGAIDAIDAKAAFSIGMIYETEKEEYRKAQKLYREALLFYSTAYDMLQEQSKAASKGRRRTQQIKDELNQRISAILLRLAVTSGQRERWEQSLHASNLAYDTFLEVDGSNFSFSEDNKIRQQIEEQINISEVMLERRDSADIATEERCTCVGVDLEAALDAFEDVYLGLMFGTPRKK